MSDDSVVAPPVDRRDSARQAASIPVAVLSDAWSVFAIVEDVSDSGALLLTREPVPVGTKVQLCVLLGSQVSPPVKAQSTVIRSGAREGTGLLWSHEVAVQFDHQSGPWDQALSAVVARQAELRRTDD